MPRVARIHALGGPEVIRIDELPLLPLERGQVRVKVAACALNRADILLRESRHAVKPQLPAALGYEAAGVISEVGMGVTGFRVGDKVNTIPVGACHGACAEYVTLPAEGVSHYPEALSPVEAAAVWMQYLTAWGALFELGRLTGDDTVLVTAASSSAGIGAIQLVKDAGATCIAVTRGASKRQALLDIGADAVVVTEESVLEEQVLHLTSGRGARLIYDAVGGSLTRRLVLAAAYQGQIFSYGVLGGDGVDSVDVPIVPAALKRVSIHPYTMISTFHQPDERERGKRYIAKRLAAGGLRPVIDRVFPFEQIVDATRYMESNAQIGKIVLTL